MKVTKFSGLAFVACLAAAPAAAQSGAQASLGISATVRPSCVVDLAAAGSRSALQLRCGAADLQRARISLDGSGTHRATPQGSGKAASVSIEHGTLLHIDF